MMCSPNFANGSSIESEPAAMMTLAPFSSTSEPSCCLTLTIFPGCNWPKPWNGGDLVGLEQRGDAAGELLHDAVLAGDHLLHVDRRRLEADAVLVEQVAHVPELATGIEQRLGRDAAHPQAGAAERGLAVLAQRGVDAGDLHPQLRGADRGVVAGRAGTDDDDIELLLFAHCLASVGSNEKPRLRRASCDYMPSSIRCGFSSWFLMSTRNSTASLPSMMRWS